MDPLFRNFLLFISGFVMAVFIVKNPVGVKNIGSDAIVFEDSIDQIPAKFDEGSLTRFRKSVAGINPGARKIRSQDENYLESKSYYTPSRSDLTASARPEVSNDQVPTAPPTGRTEDEQDPENKSDVSSSDSTGSQTNFFAQESFGKNNNRVDDKSEKDLSSMASFAGAITPTIETRNDNLNQGTRSGPGGASQRSQGLADKNEQLGVIPADFTASGLQTAKALHSTNSISEIEYLDYLSLGLNSTDTALKTSAVFETVSLKTRDAFTFQAQFANSSATNLQLASTAVSAQYKTVNDLNFLSQMISDESSVETQLWAVRSLNIVVSESTMDFNNQQIRDALVNNVYNSLVALESGHPAFDLARNISADINQKLS